jgi:hypothetical protein
MHSEAQVAQGVGDMNEPRYSTAGWLSIVGAVLFSVSFVVGIVQAVIAGKAFGYSGPVIGPSDAIGIVFSVIGVYVLIMFRRLLNDRFAFHGIDALITFSIAWTILFQLGMLALKIYTVVFGLGEVLVVQLLNLGVVALFMLTIGIIDILMGVKLLQARQELSELIAVFAYVCLASGILEASILLSPLAVVFVPVTFILIGMILLKGDERAEFV